MDPKERRANPRKPIKLAAQLDLGNGQTLPCQIADFCAEGLFVRYSGDTSRKLDQLFRDKAAKALKVRFRSTDGRKPHELHVDVRRRIDGAMGVSFTRPNTEAIGAMLAQAGASRDQGRVSLKAPSDHVQFVLRQAAKAVVQYIEPLMDVSLVEMVVGLKESAQKAGNNQQANELMDAAGQFEARQRMIWRQMAKSLESPLKPAPRGAPGAELSVVDKGEFEDWLTLRVMVTKADTQYRGDLLQLKLRLDKLGVSNSTGHHNPMGPGLICEAFHAGLSQLKTSRDVEKICLRVFDKTVLKNLEPMYRELNNILVRHGVLPDLDLSKYLSEPPSPKPQTRPDPEPKQTEPKQTEQARGPEKAADIHGQTPQDASPKDSSSRRRFTGQRSSSEFRGYSSAAQTALATVKSLLGTLSSCRVARGDPVRVSFAPGAR
jgi:hypothetical protein